MLVQVQACMCSAIHPLGRLEAFFLLVNLQLNVASSK